MKPVNDPLLLYIPYARHYNLWFVYFLLKSKNVFSRGFFLKILALCMVSIQEQFLIKSGLQWRSYGRLFLVNGYLLHVPRLSSHQCVKFSDSLNCKYVRFTSFHSGEFITVIVVNPPENKLAKRNSVHSCVFC